MNVDGQSIYSLSETQSQQLSTFLAIHSLVFSESHGLPLVRYSDHAIPLQSRVAAISMKLYCYIHHQKDEMERMISNMSAVGIIRPSSSPISSPFLLVQKKKRWYVDYCQFNKVIVSDRYLVSMIQKLLDELHGVTYFSEIDL